ncbi:MAG: hypothetical protein A2W25_11915 [candidate division Zixibacteria bacterium RBG_16_53_22]|nr:MAG: hypothetical protein A2W25_11915 [candidate division Zixibacteria bacterium RBG_16_53_22]
MTLHVINRIPDLSAVMYAMQTNQRHQSIMHAQATRGMERMLFLTRQLAPVGKYEPPWQTSQGVINHGRPSIRQHSMTLDTGWTQQVERVTHGAAFTLFNQAPHAPYVIYGTPAHPITGKPVLAFHWSNYSATGEGNWGPYQGDPPGPYSFPRVNHPGARPNTFVQQAAAQNRPRMVELLGEGAKEVRQPLINFFMGRGQGLLR